MRFHPLFQAALAGMLCIAATSRAQQPVEPPPADAQRELPIPAAGDSYKLHVYARLLQIPTVILNSKREAPTDLTRERVRISLDDGPQFLPTFLRREGEDPISLAILLDVSGSQPSTINSVLTTLPQLVPTALHPQDKLTLFIVDCDLFRTPSAPVPDAAAVSTRLDRLLHAPRLHGAKTKGACSGSLALWNAAATAIRELDETSGRRVLLIVSQGNDYKSKVTIDHLSAFAARSGAAVFALRDQQEHETDRTLGPVIGAPAGMNFNGKFVNGEDPLNYLVSRTGGLLYSTYEKEIPETLSGFFKTLRDRYIVEFTAPTQATDSSHHHSIAVTVPGLSGLIRASGDSAPLPDPATLADPTTLPSKPSEATFGKHQPRD